MSQNNDELSGKEKVEVFVTSIHDELKKLIRGSDYSGRPKLDTPIRSLFQI